MNAYGLTVFVGQGVSVMAGVGENAAPVGPEGAVDLGGAGTVEVVAGPAVTCTGSVTGWEAGGWAVSAPGVEMVSL